MKMGNAVRQGFSSRVLTFALTTGSLPTPSVGFAADSRNYRAVDGLAIYYAVLLAEVIRGHRGEHPEAAMHGGVPEGGHAHYVLIGLFDARSLRRIPDVRVAASVSEPDLTPMVKRLEPFKAAEALTDGNFLESSALASYAIGIEVRRPGTSRVVKTRTGYRHH